MDGFTQRLHMLYFKNTPPFVHKCNRKRQWSIPHPETGFPGLIEYKQHALCVGQVRALHKTLLAFFSRVGHFNRYGMSPYLYWSYF